MGDDWAKPPPWALSARHRGLVEPPAHLSTRLQAGGDAGAPEVTSQAWRAHGGLDLLRTSVLKEINPEYSLEGLMLKLQYFGHLMRRTDSFEKTLTLGKIEDRRRRGHTRPRAPSWCGLPPSGSEAYLLCPAFIRSLILVVNPAEVGNNHRDRQGNDEDTAQ